MCVGKKCTKIREYLAPINNLCLLDYRQLFEIDPANLKYNLGVAQLCLRTLPSWAGNVPFAKLCLDRALLFHPDDPDAIVKMGLYKLRIVILLLFGIGI